MNKRVCVFQKSLHAQKQAQASHSLIPSRSQPFLSGLTLLFPGPFKVCESGWGSEGRPSPGSLIGGALSQQNITGSHVSCARQRAFLVETSLDLFTSAVDHSRRATF